MQPGCFVLWVGIGCLKSVKQIKTTDEQNVMPEACFLLQVFDLSIITRKASAENLILILALKITSAVMLWPI